MTLTAHSGSRTYGEHASWIAPDTTDTYDDERDIDWIAVELAANGQLADPAALNPAEREAVWELMLAHGRSHTAAAQNTGVSRSTVSRWADRQAPETRQEETTLDHPTTHTHPAPPHPRMARPPRRERAAPDLRRTPLAVGQPVASRRHDRTTRRDHHPRMGMRTDLRGTPHRRPLLPPRLPAVPPGPRRPGPPRTRRPQPHVLVPRGRAVPRGRVAACGRFPGWCRAVRALLALGRRPGPVPGVPAVRTRMGPAPPRRREDCGMSPSCWYCGRSLRRPSRDGLGPTCRRNLHPDRNPRRLPQATDDGDIDHAALAAAGQLAIPITTKGAPL